MNYYISSFYQLLSTNSSVLSSIIWYQSIIISIGIVIQPTATAKYLEAIKNYHNLSSGKLINNITTGIPIIDYLYDYRKIQKWI